MTNLNIQLQLLLLTIAFVSLQSFDTVENHYKDDKQFGSEYAACEYSALKVFEYSFYSIIFLIMIEKKHKKLYNITFRG